MKGSVRLSTHAVLLALATQFAGCTEASDASAAAPKQSEEPAAFEAEQQANDEDVYRDYPLHGRVTGLALIVRKAPDPEAVPMGWLRRGEVVRLKPSQDTTPTCKSGWHAIHPKGFVCAGEGVEVSEAAPEFAEEDRGSANRNAPMPYQYYLVKEHKVPEYHQLPSRDQQRAAGDYAAAWLAVEREGNAQKLKKFLEGSLPGQPKKHAIIRRFLERGFYVAATTSFVRAQRKFVRSVRGSYVKEQQLEARSAPSFQGVELKDGISLPVAWAIRGATPLVLKKGEDGSQRWVSAPDKTPYERLSRIPTWKGKTRVGGSVMHDLGDGTYLHHWYLAVAQKIDKPKEVKGNEPWVHVDLSDQTLVLYRGDEPVYATLVSTGLPDFATKVGSFRIQKKYVSDTMSDIGADVADNRYSIDDVPWTQYFDGPRALHAAFWHSQYGIQRSHGCVNMAPADAFYVFQHTLPHVPLGWHGVSTQKTGIPGSLVLVTE